MDSENRLCLLLVGLTELRRRLQMAAHESLSQRIVLNCVLTGLADDEVGPYIAHRLRLAGSDVKIFDDAAVMAVAQACNGALRQIDRVAHYALHAAAVARSRTVSIDHVEQAIREVGA